MGFFSNQFLFQAPNKNRESMKVDVSILAYILYRSRDSFYTS
jgi:hypothetical protein